MKKTFSIPAEHPPRAGLTISSGLLRGSGAAATAFSLGAGTDISPERYDCPILYLGLAGNGEFPVGQEGRRIGPGELLPVAPGTLCGTKTRDGFVYTEIMLKEDTIMNNAVKSGEVLRLADLVPYEAGSIVNMDIASNEATKFVVMAFDEGTGLSPHRAPGDALVFALEGKAVIGYEGQDYAIQAGENFRFDKGGLHSVTADGRFKMALLLTLK